MQCHHVMAFLFKNTHIIQRPGRKKKEASSTHMKPFRLLPARMFLAGI